MKYIKKYDNHNEYEAVILDHTNTPNVSLCDQENELHFTELIPEE